MNRPPPVLVTDATTFQEMLSFLRTQPRIAVDTEADSLYSYFEKVCLIQFSIPEPTSLALGVMSAYTLVLLCRRSQLAT